MIGSTLEAHVDRNFYKFMSFGNQNLRGVSYTRQRETQ